MRAVTHTPLHQCGVNVVCKEMRVRMRVIFVRLGVLFAEPGLVLFPFVKT